MPTPEVLEQVARNNKNPISPLMQAKWKALTGQKVNFCPFGCTDAQLDELGYCKHIAGITLPGNKQKMEPMILDERGRRVVRAKRVENPDAVTTPDGFRDELPVYEDVLRTDTLVRIATCYRVYRGQPGDKPKQTPEEVKAADVNTLLDMVAKLQEEVAALKAQRYEEAPPAKPVTHHAVGEKE